MSDKPLSQDPARSARYRPAVLCGAQTWDEDDLLQRVSEVIDFATRVIQSLSTNDEPETENNSKRSLRLSYRKVIAETAMLLHSTASIQTTNEGLRQRVSQLAEHLIPHARRKSILVGLCADPGLTYNDLGTHAVLSRLGYQDSLVDQLLAESKALDNRLGPEKLPLDLLEQEWLAQVWSGCGSARRERGLLGRSMLGRQMDILGATRFDVYAFTHAIIYATDFGQSRPKLPRPRSAIAHDADAALSLSLDIDDLDVSAELAMTWPMLALAWSPTAIFAFGILTTTQDQLGFLPGPTFDANQCAGMSTDERSPYIFTTCYHTTYVMGMLCAAVLKDKRCPPRVVPVTGSAGSGSVFTKLLDATANQARWRVAFDELSLGQQDALAPLILTVLLRRAKDRGDLRELRTYLELARDYGLLQVAAVQQAVAFLRRSTLLSRILQRNSSKIGIG